MTEPITLDKIEQNIAFIRKMYDAVRVVDPVKKRVLGCRGCSLDETTEICYEYWKMGKICDNCISVRAYRDDRSYMKLEQSPDTIMVVTAVPIETDGNPAVLELLKNATDSMLIGSGIYQDGRPVRNFVQDLNELVIKDHLTALYNRRFVDERLPIDIIKGTIENKPLSVIFMDIDNFKSINDNYGHVPGDLALKEIGRIIKKVVPADIGWAARYGGDEFFICLNYTSYDDAYMIAEQIRKNIELTAIPVKGGSFHFTASVGINTMQEKGLTAKELITLADKKMFEAKKSGKNRTL